MHTKKQTNKLRILGVRCCINYILQPLLIPNKNYQYKLNIKEHNGNNKTTVLIWLRKRDKMQEECTMW
jgi:hypothetical protein